MGGLYKAFTELDCSLIEINPLVVDRRGRRDRARCQDELRRQRALAPQGPRGAARRRRGGSVRDRGRQVRAELRQARRPDRLHGERRGPRHGHHGHHQALWRRARQLPRCRRRRHQGARDGGVQDHPQGPQRRGHPGQHLRRHHALRRDRRGRRRRGARGQPARAAGRAARRHQRRARQEDPEGVGTEDHLGGEPRRRRRKDRHRPSRRPTDGRPGRQEHQGHLPGLHRLARAPSIPSRRSPTAPRWWAA